MDRNILIIRKKFADISEDVNFYIANFLRYGDVMNLVEIKNYCLNKHKAYETYPFGEIPICYKVNNRIFAQIYPKAEDFKITLKCTDDVGDFYRRMYPDIVVRGYHCPPVQQPYWNTIYLSGFQDDELLNMIDHAYNTVINSFSKKIQKQIAEND